MGIPHAHRRLRCRALALVALALIPLSYWQGVRLGLDVENISLRYTQYTVPIVLSETVYGHAPDYAGYADVAKLFAASNGQGAWLNQAIDAARHTDTPIDRQAHWYIVADDKGLIDFNRAAFALFGTRANSLYQAFFAFLLASVLVFLLAYRDDPRALIALALVGTGFYSVLFVLPLTDQLGSVHEPRFLEILGVIPLLHVVWLLADSRGPSIQQVIYAAVQISALVLVFHIRSSAGWQLLCLASTVLIIGSYTLRRRPRMPAGHVIRGGMALLGLAMGLFLIGGHVTKISNAEYRSKHSLTHVFWHNLFMGFAVHPELADELGLTIDDTTVTRALKRYLARTDRKHVARELFGDGQYIADNFRDFDWVSYEPRVREMFWHTVRSEPSKVLAALLVYKPALFLREALWAAGIVATDREKLFLEGHSLPTDEERRDRGLFWNPLRWEMVLTCVLILGLAWPERDAFGPAARAIAWLGSFSFLPLILVCPLFQYSGVALCLVAALLYGGVLLSATASIRIALARTRVA